MRHLPGHIRKFDLRLKRNTRPLKPTDSFLHMLDRADAIDIATICCIGFATEAEILS